MAHRMSRREPFAESGEVRGATRDRHVPRLCAVCGAPLASQEESCWSCGARWGAAEIDATGGRAAREARDDADRWTDEGGGLRSERDEAGPAVRH